MDNNLNVNLFKKDQILIVAVLVLLVVFIMFFSFQALGSGDANTDFSKRYIDYGSNWNLTIDGISSTVNLPVYTESGKDSLIVLSKTLPASIPEYSALAMRNYHQVMYVRVNGVLIYTYPSNPSDDFTLLSDAWSIINLSPEYSGANLEITLRNLTARPFSGYIYDVYFGDSNSLIQHLKDQTSFAFMTGVIIIIIGVFVIGLSILFRKYINQIANTPMGLAMIFFGVWMMNRARPPFFSGSNGRVFLLAITCLLLVAPFLFLFNSLKTTKHRALAYFGFAASIVFGIFVMVARSMIKFSSESVAMVSYIFCAIAIINTFIILYNSAFGKDASLKSKSDLIPDKVECAATLLFIIAPAAETILNRDKLWTDISLPFRYVILAYALTFLITMFGRIYTVAQERAIVTQRLHESQLELMMAQIQPHFMFNALSSIRTMVKVDPDVAYDMLYDFSKYLRANVDNMTNLDGIKFSAEVDHIKSYTNIELVRFSGRLNMEFDIQSDDFLVPPLSIQPLVENAIKHGVSKKVDGGTVLLKSYEESDCNVVEIRDNGIGISAEAAVRIFGASDTDSNLLAISAMHDIMKDLKLFDEQGNPISLNSSDLENISRDSLPEPINKHKSAGMMNIIMRLREMANARIEITSQVNNGTSIKVSFPK